MSSDLKHLYQDCLGSAFIELSDGDKLVNHLPGTDNYVPLMLDGKPIRLSGNGVKSTNDIWLAHPLMEVVSSEPTPVVARLITAHAQALHLKMQSLFTSILLLAISPAQQSLCQGDTGDILRACKGVKDSDLETLRKLASEINNPASTDHRFIRLKIKPNLRKDKVTYQYGVVASFPLYEKLTAVPKPRKIGRTSIPQIVVDNYVAVMRAMFSDIDSKESFLYEPLVETSPRYSSALNAVSDIAERLNEIAAAMKGFDFDYDQIHTDLGWVEDLKSFKSIYHPQALTWTRERASASAAVEQSINPTVTSNSMSAALNSAASNLFAQGSSLPSASSPPPAPAGFGAPQLPTPSAPTESSNKMTLEEFRKRGINANARPTGSAQVMRDANGQEWVVRDGVATAVQAVGVGAAPPTMTPQMQPAMMRPVAPAIPAGAVGTWMDPASGITWYVDAMNRPLGQVYPAVTQAAPAVRPGAGINWQAVANGVVQPANPYLNNQMGMGGGMGNMGMPAPTPPFIQQQPAQPTGYAGFQPIGATQVFNRGY